MYINKERIRCGSFTSGVLALVGSALIFAAIFLPWWDVGNAKELLNLDNAPPVVATLWDFFFYNPPSWVTKPRGREPSTWQAYCERDAAAQLEALPPNTTTTSPNETLVGDGGSSTSGEASSSGDDDDGMESNETSVTLTTTTSTPAPVTEPPFAQDRVPKIPTTTTLLPENPLHPGTCDLLPMLPTLLLAAAALGPGAALCFFLAWCGTSLLALLTGAVLAGSAVAGACSALFFAGLLSFQGLFSASGPQCVLGGVAFTGGSAVLAVYNSVKALTRPPKRQMVIGGEAEVSDEEEISPEERQAKLKADARLSRLERLKVAQERRLRQLSKDRKKTSKETRDVPKALARVLRWGSRRGQGGRFGKDVPLAWLEEAFREIDVTNRMVITMEQFMNAVQRCGYHTKRSTFEDLLNEMDEEKKSDILTQSEFIQFFRKLEESLKQEASRKSRALIRIFFCNVCFFAHVVGMSVVLLLTISQEAAAPREELDAIRRAERDLVNVAFQLVGASLSCFFLLVVVIPLLRVSVGASLGAWQKHFAGVWREYLARWRGEEIGDGDPHSGSKDSMDAVDPEASLTPASMARSTASLTPSAPSRRDSRASLGSQMSRRSLESGASASSAGKKKKGILRRAKAFVDSLILPPKHKKRRRRSENLKYDTSAFEEANMRALAAQVEQVSTFSLMQVRDLHYRIPDPANVVPPSFQQPPLLPGTPAGVTYSVSNPELTDVHRPASPDPWTASTIVSDPEDSFTTTGRRQAYTDR